MTPTMLRQFWSLIENTHSSVILSQDDSSLVTWLITQMKRQPGLEAETPACLDDYIRSRTTLIRDIVEAR
ncbi:MAG: hypothetical protein F6J87_13220 [Spirulina sp. SIO3F2]|nr:hypothetical protein [Spirulina sp. SIO3F2]